MTVFDALKIEKSNIPMLDKEIILSYILGISRQDLFFSRKKEITKESYDLYISYLNKRAQGCPVSYITKEKEFYSLSFTVSEDVLIPRPDTETLVDFAIKYSKGKKVLDLCCGSGCIGISVAKNSDVQSVTFADISENALNIARENALKHGVNGEFIQTDILKDEICGKYDIILTNPPYIKSKDILKLQKDVKDYEPTGALDGGETGLDFYEPIVKKAVKSLNCNGYLAAEIGFDQAKDVTQILIMYLRSKICLA